MTSVFSDLRRTLQYPGNSLMKFIIVNVAVFVLIKLVWVVGLLFQLSLPLDQWVLKQLAVPASLHSLLYKPWTLFTYMFLHEGVFHILFNMLVLYWFGQILTEYLGNKKFVYTYILGGISGAVFYIVCFNLFPLFTSTVEYSQALGASGAVMAIVFATATLLPDYSVMLFIIGSVRLKYIALFYLIFDLIGIGSINSGGHLAHLGGALFGFIMVSQLRKGNDFINGIDRQVQKLRSLFIRKPKLRVAHKANTTTQKPRKPHSETDQAVIDAILDKISKSGYESLSKEEKQILFKASNQK
jgi:membrane associated rhomboid family serine protease